MTELTDDQVRALAHRYRFAKDDHERTIAQTARALLATRAELAQARADTDAAAPVAWKYRWKIDGEYVGWRYSDASNAHPSLDGYEEVPLYDAPPAGVAKLEAVPVAAQCCMCGKGGLSTAEDGGPECELHDGRWVCSRDCWETASATPTDPGDGWTWNERLGWIGPDGNPLDPRRRG